MKFPMPKVQCSESRGMTLIETLVAITILSVAIVAPMQLTISSLASANYARDQVVAANLAQEAIESVRSVRDENILAMALTAGSSCADDGLPMHLLCNIPIDEDFVIDTRNNEITSCSGTCPKLQTDPAQTLYGYGLGNDTFYLRVVRATYVDVAEDEVRITVTVTRDSGVHQLTPTVISENLYRWVGSVTTPIGVATEDSSCKAILDAGNSIGSGVYSIDPDGDGGSAAFDVYCDMVFLGGGWTRIAFEGITAANSSYSSSAWTNGTGSSDGPTTPGHVSRAFHTLGSYSEVYKDGNLAGGGSVAACGAGLTMSQRMTNGTACTPTAVSGMTVRTLSFNMPASSCGTTRVSTGYWSYDGGTSYYWLGIGSTGSVMWGGCYGPPDYNGGSMFVR